MRVCPVRQSTVRVTRTRFPGTLHAAFQYMGYAELLGDLAHIALACVLVLHHACAANYFQVGDLARCSQNFILHAICEVGVLLIDR